MPIKPLPIRLLCPSLPVTRHLTTTMSLTPSLRHHHRLHTKPAVGPTLSRIFPFKLKYHGLGFHFPASRNLSTRSRPDGRPGGKSLVEDEDELSDWVTGLRTSSLRAGVFTEDEEDNERGVVNGRRGNVGSGGRGGKRGSVSNFVLDDEAEGRRGGYNSVGSRGKRGRGSNLYSYEGESEEERGNFGGRGRRGGYDSKRGGLSSYSGDRMRNSDGNSRFGGELGGRGGGRGRGRGRGRGEFRRGEGRVVSRGESNGGRGRGRGEFRGGEGRVVSRGESNGVRSRGRAALVSSEEDEDEVEIGGFDLRRETKKEKSVSGFLDLIGEDEDDSEDEDDEDEKIESRSRSSLFANEGRKESSDAPSSPGGGTDSYLSETRFDQCAVSPLSLKAIKDAGYEKMTMVQEATLPIILKGKDVMAKAKTGTGKTVAFLLPSIEVVIKTPPAGPDQKRPPILVLVICPTRELASQAAAEANTLLKYHTSIGVQVVMGGTRLAVEQKRMQANPCQVLVATPGRLKDHLENTAGFSTRLMGVKVVVLDEADHLLDMGFRRDIERIISAVPKQRQTLLFSATIPDEVRQICHIALKRDYEFVNTVVEGTGETHSRVSQMHLVAPLENHFSLLYAILKEHISDDVNYKVLVFCTTAMVTRLVAGLLGELNLNVREIHSRKPQSYRTRVSDEFRKSKGLILVTSDVSARGVDYPDVTLVIQLGLPSDREQYIHRLGRTGRKGKEGQGILLLAPWEEFFLNSVKDIPIPKATAPMVDPDMRKKVERALSQVEMKNKEAAYQAWLGYYNSNKMVGRDKHRLVELANEFSRSMGLDNPPAIPKLVLGKMGLKNVPGLRTK